ncbi:MAG: MFS transporter [Candidatus Omnitrophica bacterium]|nr:MFS transporter [Candidatus Omnitrophota bacterium]
MLTRVVHQFSESLARIFRSTRHRNFRLFVCGQSVSLIGTWMQMIAVSWLVYRLTSSPFLLGCAAFVTQIPSFVLFPFAGVLADRIDRHKILLAVQILAMVQSVILAVLVLTNHVAVWQVLVLGFFLGVVNAFDLPARQAFISEMIDDREDLNNAIALHSSLFNGSRLFGPALAGIVIAAFGEGVCFALNALSFIPIIVALFMMRIPPRDLNVDARKKVKAELKEGFRYAMASMPIRTLLLLLTIVSFMAGALQTLMPIFAKEVYHGGPQTLGFIVAMSGVGALVGALYLAGRKNVIGLGRIIGVSSGFFGVLLIVFGFVTNLHLAALVVFFMGFAMIMEIGSTNVILQTIVDEDKRGRVMSLYGGALIGMTPVGSLLAGVAATHVGLPVTLGIGGAACLIACAFFWKAYPDFRGHIRAVYTQKGIIK